MLNTIHTNPVFCKNHLVKVFTQLMILFTVLLPVNARNVAHILNYRHVCLTYDTQPDDSLKVVEITGTVKSVYHEYIDSVAIAAKTGKSVTDAWSDETGFFIIRLPVDPGKQTDNIHLTFSRYDYKPFDTTIIISQSGYPENLDIILAPRYKILLKGRLFAGNLPVEDVNVEVSFGDQLLHLKTLKCYTDEEDYWNCLYLGMFKTELITDNPEDSIQLLFSKSGFKSQTYKLKFADYSGDLLRFKLRYADTIPDLPGNLIAFKLTYPTGKNSGWFIGFSFYSNLNFTRFSRVMPGFEVTMSSYKRSVSFATLPGTSEGSYDTIYTHFFIGPSLLFYLTKPYVKRFSTYTGSAFSLDLNNSKFVLQPFIGTRYFIDIRRSISLDLRYIPYHLDVDDYSFSFAGNAKESNQNIKVKRILVNLGVQINF